MKLRRGVASLLSAVLFLGAGAPARAAGPVRQAGATASADGDAEAQQYRITKAEGQVLFMAAGESTWVSAEEDMDLSQGDRVKTMARASAEIGSADGDVIELDEKSEFEVGSDKKDDSSFDLKVGRFLFNIINRPNKKFAIKTPLTSVAVRGTEFAVYEEDGGWEGGVVEGKIAVTSTEVQEPEVLVGTEEGFRAARGQGIRRRVGLPPRMVQLRPRFAKMRQRHLEMKRQWRRDTLKRKRELRRRMPRRPGPQ